MYRCRACTERHKDRLARWSMCYGHDSPSSYDQPSVRAEFGEALHLQVIKVESPAPMRQRGDHEQPGAGVRPGLDRARQRRSQTMYRSHCAKGAATTRCATAG